MTSLAFTSDLSLKVGMGQAMEMARGANKAARRKRGHEHLGMEAQVGLFFKISHICLFIMWTWSRETWSRG